MTEAFHLQEAFGTSCMDCWTAIIDVRYTLTSAITPGHTNRSKWREKPVGRRVVAYTESEALKYITFLRDITATLSARAVSSRV